MPSDTFTFEEASAPDTFSFEEASDTPSLQPVLSASEIGVRPPSGFVPASEPYGVALSNELVPPPEIFRQAGEKMEQEYQRPLVNIPSEPFKAISGPVAQIFGQPAAEQFEKRLAGGLSSMTSKEGLATIPYFLVPGLGRLLGIGYGTQQVASGAGSISGGDVGGGLADLLMGGALLKGSAHSRVPSEPVLPDSIKAVAVRSPEGEILTGPLGTRHNEIAKEADIPEPPEKDRGFVIQTPKGEETVLGTEGRKEALPIAEEAGQVKPDEELTPKLQDLKDEGELHGAMTKPPATVEELANLKAEGDVPEKFGVKSFALEGENPESVLQRAELYRTDSPFGLDLVKQGGFELRDKAPELAGKEDLNPTSAAQWAAISDARKGGTESMREWVDEAFKSRREQRKAMADFEDAKTDAEKEDAINRAQTSSNQFLNEGLQAVGNWGKEFGVDAKTVAEARRLSAEFSKGAEALTEPAKEVTPLEKETQGKEEGVLAPEGEAAPQAKPAPVPQPVQTATSKIGRQLKHTANVEGQRSAKDVKEELVQRLQESIKSAPPESSLGERAKKSLEYWRGQKDSRKFQPEIEDELRKSGLSQVTIDIPGDGKFTIWNTKENLEQVLSKAKKLSTNPNPEPFVSRTGISKQDSAEVERILANPEPVKEAVNNGTASPWAFGQFMESVSMTPEDFSLPKLRTLAARNPAAWNLLKKYFALKTVPEIHRAIQTRLEERQQQILATQPSKTSEIHIQAQEQANPSHAFGIVSPQSIPLQKLISGISGPIENIASWAREMWRGFANKQAPKITDADRVTGEKAARLVAAPLAGRAKGIEFARKVMEETGLDDYKLGVAAVEDNLRGLRDERNAEADRLEQQGKTEEASALRESASDVNSIVGAKHSPFKTESEYQAYINRPDVQAAAAMHRQMWSEQKDPLYRQANDLDPETPLATRGRQLGMRINLKAIMPGETAVRAVGGSSKTLRQLATLKRRDPFAQRAKGTAQQYEGSYTEMMANGFGRELPVAAQHNFIRSLIESGNAQVSDRMYSTDLKIKDEPTVGYLIRLNPWRGKFLQVRRSLANEYEAVSGLDKALDIPILKPFNNFMTRQSVQGLAEGTTHMGNLMTQIFTGLGPTSNPILNAVIKSLGRADLIWQVPKVFIKAMTDQTPRMVELAEIGATKEPYRGQVSKVLLNPIDKSVRVISDDIYKGMAENGWVEDTETGRREYVNQVGNYHKQLQPVLMRRLRETGLNPFVTAGQTYNVMGLRRMVLAPGAKATSNAAALALRADILGGWMGFVTLVTGINLLTSGKADGPKGTPLGAVGWKDEDGNLHYFNVARWLGYERGPRATGILSAVEAKRAGLSSRQQIESAAGAQGSTGLSYLMGPGARFLWISMFGTRPTQPNVQESPKVPPTDSMNPLKTQLAANIKQALIEANPLINSIVDLRSGKGLSDIAQKQASRYSPRQGRTEEYYSKLPKIVERKQLVEYGEDVAKSARKLPLSQRMGYVNKRFSDDGLEFKYRQEAIQEVRRHGVFTHQ